MALSFLDKVQDLVKSASDKTSEVIEVSKLKAGIAEEKRAIQEELTKLGAIYYALYQQGEILTPDAVNICMVVDKHNTRIAEKEEELKKINEANAEKKAVKTAPGEVECPECHSINPEGTKFCCDCGAKIPEIVESEAVDVTEETVEEVTKKTCSNCGAEVGEGKRFCSECGTKVE